MRWLAYADFVAVALFFALVYVAVGNPPFLRPSSRRRLALITVGVLVAAAPSSFAVFPRLAALALWIRLLSALLWLVVVVVAVFESVRQAETLEVLKRAVSPEIKRRQQEEKESAFTTATGAIMAAPPGFPSTRRHALVLYILNAETAWLEPRTWTASISKTHGEAPQSWKVGCGAVGVAFAERKWIVAKGPDVYNAERFNLTADEQERYRRWGLKIVGAMPIYDAEGTPIGVLAASTTTDSPFLDGERGSETMEGLAAILARLVIDLLPRRRG